MPAFQYKQKCTKCKKNYVIVTWKNKFPVCYDCQKGELSKEITDKGIKKLFAIPENLYQNNAFLRNIKISYLRYGSLTDKQKDAFKKAVEKMKKDAASFE